MKNWKSISKNGRSERFNAPQRIVIWGVCPRFETQTLIYDMSLNKDTDLQEATANTLYNVLPAVPSIVYNDDCMHGLKRFPDKCFDLAIVDPPYGIGAYWMKQKHTQHYGLKDWNESAPGAEYFEQLFRVSKNQIVWGGNYFTKFLPVTNSWIYWDKGSDVQKMNTSEGELAWTSFKIPMRKIYVQWSGARKGNETGIKCIHPCQRPIALHDWLLMNYASEGDLILDTHLGSGSIAIACHYMKRKLIGYEIDAEYYEKACKRFKEQTAQQALW